MEELYILLIDQNGLLKESKDQFLIILQAQYGSKFLKEF